MTSRRRMTREREPSGSGSKKKHPMGCEAIRGWLEKSGSGVDISEEAKGELRRIRKEPALMECFEEIFREASEPNQETILRWAVPLLGSLAHPFLEKVVADPQTSLATKKVAVNHLRELGSRVEADLLESIEKAVEIVRTRFPAATLSGEACDGPAAELFGHFCTLPEVLRVSVVRETLVQDPGKAVVLLQCFLDRKACLPEGILPFLGAVPGEETARLLLKWYDCVQSKAFRKDIKKTLHRRRVKGLPVVEPEAVEARGPVWRPPVPAQPVGLLSMPDSTGSRMVWVMRQQIPKGILVFAGWTHDLEGLKEIAILDFTKKESETYKQSILKDEKLCAVETDAAYCASLIEEAYQKAGPASPDQKEMYKHVRGMLLELVPAEAPVSPIHDVWREDVLEQGSTLEDPFGGAAGLLDKGLLEEWFLETERLKPFVERLEEIQTSRIIVHPLQKQERIASFQQEAARELFSDPPYRTAWKRRIEDAAWVLYKKGMENDSRRLCLISRYLGNPDNDASRVPFLVHFVQKTLKAILESKKTQEAENPSLIVKPGTPVR